MNPYKRETSAERQLLAAVANGRNAEAKLCIQRGEGIRVQGAFGEYPLHWAAARGDNELCVQLIEAGALVTDVDGSGDTPAEVARNFGHASLAHDLDLLKASEQQTAANKLGRPGAEHASPRAR